MNDQTHETLTHDRIIKRYKNRMKRLAKKRARPELRRVYVTIARELDTLMAVSNDAPRKRR